MNGTDQTVPADASSSAWPEGGQRVSQRRGPAKILIAGLVAACLVGGAAILASHQASGYFLFSPGTAPVITAKAACRPSAGDELALPDGTPCVRLLLPASRAHPVDGKLFMVDVELSQASPLNWAEYELGILGDEHEMVPVAQYAGPTPPSQLGCQDSQEMASANQDAAVAALRALGYRIDDRPVGAEVTGVVAGTPAWDAGVKCNDLITAVDGRAVDGPGELASALAGLAPGTVVALSEHHGETGRVQVVKARLLAPPPKMVALGFTGRSYLGVELAPLYRPALPFPVSVDAGDIGGPSAGLAFTLAILDSLSGGRLTAGHEVAATGTMAPDGSVGPVGGVREKTAAVEKAGAQVFFVPKEEYPDATEVADRHLTVIPVTSLDQVLEILESRYGGQLPTVKASALDGK